jgi:hypothetical protein
MFPTTDAKAKKSVSFSATGLVRSVLHLTEYTKEEIEACWYTSRECSEIKQEIKRTVVMIQNNRPIDERECSRRGVEIRTNEGSKISSYNKRRALCNVLNEQMRPKFDPVRHEMLLSAIYQDCTNNSKMAARLMGLADQEIANALSKEQEGVKRIQRTSSNKLDQSQKNLIRLPRKLYSSAA